MSTETGKEESKEFTREAMIRWQGYARESRTAVNSHFLAYSAAILALQVTILLDNKAKTIDWPCLFSAGGFLAMSSLLLGSITVLARLRDARLTARIARYKYQERAQQEIDSLRSKANFYGAWIHRLLPLQVISFTISAISFCTWAVVTNWERI
ncbi:hypothetical protein [Stutzerimonas azotifigens]|uniref:DUF4231 domain-containing protein n=1 Tax=Stutzerimonas azotifigens TaxID=291995 RepID=A0ABR5Z5G3_9GAMM|nr:hypothetical protein [Stutzerimonas azotifigens]MBA1275458.1 hypothetical protein [Stutzerimonas azotifigens]